MLILSVSDICVPPPSAAASAARPFFSRLSEDSVFRTCFPNECQGWITCRLSSGERLRL